MKKSFLYAYRLSLICVLLGGLSIEAAAQTAAAPRRMYGQVVRIKPDMVNEWFDLQKNEVVPALKKAGVTSRNVQVTNIGVNFEFSLFTPIEKFAELDADNPLRKALGDPAAFRLMEKLRKCILFSSSFVTTYRQDLSNSVQGGITGGRIRAVRVRINQGRMADFENFFKSEVLPVYQREKAGFAVYQRGMGTNPNDVVISFPIANYAEMDAPGVLQRALGQEGVDKIMAKLSELSTVQEQTIRTTVADLSF